MAHFDTAKGYPQTRDEVLALSTPGLHEFMGECSEEPADFNGCLACFAYKVAQEREDKEWEVPPPPKAEVPAALKEIRETDQVRQHMLRVLEEMLEDNAKQQAKIDHLMELWERESL